MAKEEIVRRAVEGVEMARELCNDVEFSPEDASRTELDFLTEVVEKVIQAGAMPDPVLQADDHLGRFAPSVARRFHEEAARVKK